MPNPLVTADWGAIAHPLPPPPGARGPRGPPPVPNRVALTGILFVLKTGLPWEYFPQELGCCGMTLWNRLRDWQRAGVWERLHHTLLHHLADAGQIDWRRASADAARIPAKGVKKGAPRQDRTRPTGASPGRMTIWWPTDRAPRWLY